MECKKDGGLRCDCGNELFYIDYDRFNEYKIMRIICHKCGNYRVQRLEKVVE